MIQDLAIAAGRSIVFMPDRGKPYPTLLAFLTGRFPKIPAQTWRARIAAGKVLSEERQPVSLDTAYQPGRRLFYFREVDDEPALPFREQVLFVSDHLMVVCKPHFLPVTPGGRHVHETLLNRLQHATDNPALSPIHRIDRETAGLVLLSVNKATRGLYQQLFMHGQVTKTYEAIADLPAGAPEAWQQGEWLVENRLEPGEPWFLMKSCPGKINARSQIRLLERSGSKARLQLRPLTGKKHQLRLHLSGLGLPITNDRYYPQLLPEIRNDYRRPLQLLSQQIEFTDPITGLAMMFLSPRNLSLETEWAA